MLLKRPSGKAETGRSARLEPGQGRQRHLLEFGSSLSCTSALPETSASSSLAPSEPASRNTPIQELWVDKYAPRCGSDLAMHKKKVDEVRDWLRQADTLLQLGLPPTPRLLVLSGPPGSGKSTILRVLAEEMQFELCEWTEPRAQAWSRPRSEDERTPLAAQISYESRVSQFESFLHSSLRTLSLCVGNSVSSSSGTRRRLVLLDEMASANSGGSFGGASTLEQQQALLRRALPRARFPIALVLTVSSDATGSVHKQLEQLGCSESSLQHLITHIQVNPVAETFLSKALRHICTQERLGVTAEEISDVAIRSNGDLRSALHTLQFACIGVERELMGNPRLKRSRGSRASGTGNSSTSCVPMSKSSSKEETGLRRVQGNDRDRFLDLFQAIGKILHRPAKCAKQGVEMLLTSRAAHGSNDSLPECSTNFLETGCSRGGAAAMGTPADSFVPELVLQSSYLDEGTSAAFLHQNYLAFFEDINDVADASAHLSDAALLVHAHRRRPWQTPLLPYVASLASRGVTTCNRQPAPSKFTQVSKPQLFTVERTITDRRERATAAFRPTSDGTSQATCSFASCSSAGSNLVAEVLPFVEIIVRLEESKVSSFDGRQEPVTGTGRDWGSLQPFLAFMSNAQRQSLLELTAFGQSQSHTALALQRFSQAQLKPAASRFPRAAALPKVPLLIDDEIEEV